MLSTASGLIICSDCWAKFLDSSTILVSRVPEEHPLYDEYEVTDSAAALVTQ